MIQPGLTAQALTAKVTRRAMLATAAAALHPLRLAAGKPVNGLEILGAPTGATISLVRAIASGALAKAAPDASLRLWRDTDDLRAAIVSGHTKLFSTPTHVPANLANRGMPLKLLCLLGMGHLSVITTNDKINTFADLAGKPVLGFFRNDMPDLVFRACAKLEGLDPDKDMQLSYVQTSMEAAQMLAGGRASAAILSEPVAAIENEPCTDEVDILERAANLLRRPEIRETFFRRDATDAGRIEAKDAPDGEPIADLSRYYSARRF